MGRTLQKYSAGDKYMLSFNYNTPVKIFSKSAGSNLDVWGVDIQGRRGYVPKKMIREERIIFPTVNLMELPTELAEETTKESEVEGDKITATIIERQPESKVPEPETIVKEKLETKTPDSVENPETAQLQENVPTSIDTNITVEQTEKVESTEKPEAVVSETLSTLVKVETPAVESKPNIEKTDESVTPESLEENDSEQEEEEEGDDEVQDSQEDANIIKREVNNVDSNENSEEMGDYDENKKYEGSIPVNEPPFVKKHAYVTGDNKEKSKDDEFPSLEIVGLNNEELLTANDQLSAENKTVVDEKTMKTDSTITTTTIAPSEELVKPIDVLSDVTTPIPIVETPTKEEGKKQETKEADQQQNVADVASETQENIIANETVEQKVNKDEPHTNTKIEENVTQLNIEKSIENSNENTDMTENLTNTNSTVDNVKSDSLHSEEIVSTEEINPISISTELDGSNTTNFDTIKNETVNESKGSADKIVDPQVLGVGLKSDEINYSQSFLPKGVSAEVVNSNVPLETNKEAEDFIKQELEPIPPVKPIPEATAVNLAENKPEEVKKVENVEQVKVATDNNLTKETKIEETVQNVQAPAEKAKETSTENILNELEVSESVQIPQTEKLQETTSEEPDQQQETTEINSKEEPLQQKTELPIADKVPIDMDIPTVTKSPVVEVTTEDIWAYKPIESTETAQEAEKLQEDATEPWYNSLLIAASDTFDVVYSKVEDLINRRRAIDETKEIEHEVFVNGEPG